MREIHFALQPKVKSVFFLPLLYSHCTGIKQFPKAFAERENNNCYFTFRGTKSHIHINKRKGNNIRHVLLPNLLFHVVSRLGELYTEKCKDQHYDLEGPAWPISPISLPYTYQNTTAVQTHSIKNIVRVFFAKKAWQPKAAMSIVSRARATFGID
jgi:hypothetical protein